MVWVGLDMIGQTLCLPTTILFQVLGCTALLLLGTGWSWTSLNIKWMNSEELEDSVMPGVSVVLPVKDVRQHSISNWIAQMASRYKGSLEFIFVVEAVEDMAVSALETVMKQVSHINARIEIAGFAKSTSQKIHNMLHGLSATCPTSKYILFLDDDVALNEDSITRMISKIEKNPEIFLLTGYPFDIPSEDASLLSFAVMSFHLPLMIPFCIGYNSFVWGGCMLLKRKHLMDGDPYGILSAWKDGGYSDDMIIASKCIEHKLVVTAAPASMFPQRLESNYTWSQLFNYLRRQLYVMDTYASEHNRYINHLMLGVHMLASFSFVAAILTGFMRIALWQVDLVLILTRRIFSSEDASVDWPKIFDIAGCSISTVTTMVWLITFLFACGSLASALGGLMNHVAHFFPAYSDLGLDLGFLCKVWIGLCITNAIIPFCALYTLLTSSIVWSGIRYIRKHGKIVQMERVPAM